jgi:DNA-binding transcriptional LysR family regulator
MELRHLRYAVAVAEEGSFTKAAKRLHLVQQALSQQIADLEGELGVRLFERTPRGVVPTAAGAVLVQEAIGTLANVGRTVDALRRLQSGAPRTIRVGACPSFQAARLVIVEAVRRFHDREPDVQVELTELASADGIAALFDGRVDVAFTHTAPGASSALDSLMVWEEPWTAVLLPSRHRLAAHHPLWLRDLTELPMLASTAAEDPALHERTMAALAERGLSPQLAPIRVGGVPEAVVELVAAGMGWGLMTPSARSQFRGLPGLAFRTFADDPIPRLGMWAMARHEDGSPLVASFLTVLQSRVSGVIATLAPWRSLG